MFWLMQHTNPPIVINSLQADGGGARRSSHSASRRSAHCNQPFLQAEGGGARAERSERERIQMLSLMQQTNRPVVINSLQAEGGGSRAERSERERIQT